MTTEKRGDMTTDHAAKARDALATAHDFAAGEEFALADLTLKAAQVHAQLALVEQQRIANLVALYTNPSADVATAMEASGVSFSRLIRQIKEGMGLS